MECSLAEFIENRRSMPDECLTVDGRLNAVAGAVKKAKADSVLHIGNRLRHGGL